MKLKYIITKKGDPIVFPQTIQHQEFSDFEPISAGFCSINISRETGNLVADCYGESVSLKLKARVDVDSELLTRRFLRESFY